MRENGLGNIHVYQPQGAKEYIPGPFSLVGDLARLLGRFGVKNLFGSVEVLPLQVVDQPSAQDSFLDLLLSLPLKGLRIFVLVEVSRDVLWHHVLLFAGAGLYIAVGLVGVFIRIAIQSVEIWLEVHRIVFWDGSAVGHLDVLVDLEKVVQQAS